jgi:hypothetical protein
MILQPFNQYRNPAFPTQICVREDPFSRALLVGQENKCILYLLLWNFHLKDAVRNG